MTRGVSTTLPTKLPGRFKRGVAWNVDRRCKAVREYAFDMMRLGESLGGLDLLSEQQVWLVEEAAYWHARLLENRAAVLSGRPATLTVGEHQNGTSTLIGLLNKLGLKRVARNVDGLGEWLRGKAVSEPIEPASAVPAPDLAVEATGAT
jgi:hypothetical protein